MTIVCWTIFLRTTDGRPFLHRASGREEAPNSCRGEGLDGFSPCSADVVLAQ